MEKVQNKNKKDEYESDSSPITSVLLLCLIMLAGILILESVLDENLVSNLWIGFAVIIGVIASTILFKALSQNKISLFNPLRAIINAAHTILSPKDDGSSESTQKFYANKYTIIQQVKNAKPSKPQPSTTITKKPSESFSFSSKPTKRFTGFPTTSRLEARITEHRTQTSSLPAFVYETPKDFRTPYVPSKEDKEEEKKEEKKTELTKPQPNPQTLDSKPLDSTPKLTFPNTQKTPTDPQNPTPTIPKLDTKTSTSGVFGGMSGTQVSFNLGAKKEEKKPDEERKIELPKNSAQNSNPNPVQNAAQNPVANTVANPVVNPVQNPIANPVQNANPVKTSDENLLK
jgi:hypothetical protein